MTTSSLHGSTLQQHTINNQHPLFSSTSSCVVKYPKVAAAAAATPTTGSSRQAVIQLGKSWCTNARQRSDRPLHSTTSRVLCAGLLLLLLILCAPPSCTTTVLCQIKKIFNDFALRGAMMSWSTPLPLLLMQHGARRHIERAR